MHLKAYYFHGEKVVVEEVPAHMEALVSEKRRELIETVAPVDDKLAKAFCSERPISSADLQVCGHNVVNINHFLSNSRLNLITKEL